MSWKTFLMTFGAVFLAELGDKTQLATFALAAGAKSRWPIFLAASLALTCTSAVAVIGADWIARVLSPEQLRKGAAALFILLGVVTWFRDA